MDTLDSFTEAKIVAETKKLLYLYELKHVIRYGQTREDVDYTESVAEHIYGMHILADYFRPLEDPNSNYDMSLVYQLITWHELDEIETGDIPAVRKTDADRAYAEKMLEVAFEKLPDSLRQQARETTRIYQEQILPEARYVKAIDKFEPMVHSFHPLGKSAQQKLQQTTQRSKDIKAPYIKDFPFIKIFSDTLHDVRDREGYFFNVPTNTTHT
jgi:5'-deoxynucleotidase YfbR-like HD superfamily hydrolase